MKEFFLSGSLLLRAHEELSYVLDEGGFAVDATLGNGYDALFLAKLVGDSGKVIGFDLQEVALDVSRQRLLDAGISKNCFQFYLTSHDQMGIILPDIKISAIMFNLGYLPGADKSFITKKKSTLIALSQSAKLLSNDGVLSVMCYPGHEGGDEEARAVSLWMDQLEKGGGFDVRVVRREDSRETSPFLFLVNKRGGC